MRRTWEPQDCTRALGGLALILVGLVFLLEPLGLARRASTARVGPVILVLIGVVGMLAIAFVGLVDLVPVARRLAARLETVDGRGGWVAPDTTRQIAQAVGLALVGLWLLACIRQWGGLSYRTAWPLVLVIFGIERVVCAMLDRRAWPGRTRGGVDASPC